MHNKPRFLQMLKAAIIAVDQLAIFCQPFLSVTKLQDVSEHNVLFLAVFSSLSVTGSSKRTPTSFAYSQSEPQEGEEPHFLLCEVLRGNVTKGDRHQSIGRHKLMGEHPVLCFTHNEAMLKCPVCTRTETYHSKQI